MKSIFCIDDDHNFLKFLEAILPGRINNSSDSEHSYHFEFIDDPAKGIQRIEGIQKNGEELVMVISDENMPGMKGVDLLEKIQPMVPNAKKVLVTGGTGSEASIKAINNNILDKYIVKPIKDKEDFVIILRNLLNTYRMERVVESQRQQLIQADRMVSLGTMAAGVAHEINNPLNIAIGDIHLVRRDLSDLVNLTKLYSKIILPPEESKKIESVKEDIDLPYMLEHADDKPSRCEEALKRIQNIVKNLRVFTHLDTGEIAAIDINRSIEIALQLIPEKYRQGVEIKTEFGQLPTVTCYGRDINQAFMDIILNAFQAMKGKGLLVIRTLFEEDKYAVVKISDAGPGIPQDKIKRIFEPFYTTKPIGEGTGLGLSTSYTIITKHGGDITVENNKDKGVTCTVRLLKE